MRILSFISLLIISLTVNAQKLIINILNNEPYWVGDTISVEIFLKNTTTDTITFFDSRGASWKCFEEKWELSASNMVQQILPMNGMWNSKFSDSLFISLFPNRDTLIRSMTIPIEREGYHSLTYTQKQSQDLIQKQNADTTVTDSIIRRVKTFNLSANSKYIAYTFYDTTITELINMNWNEWKEYRTTKVYTRDNYFDNIYAALKRPTDVYKLDMWCNKLSEFEITRLGRLKNLRSLILKEYELDTFPLELANLNLYELTIIPKKGNTVHFPYGFSTNNTLRELKVIFNSGVPETISGLTNLEVLDVSDSQTETLPYLGSLTSLQEIAADNANLNTLQGYGLESLPNLKKVNFSGNKNIKSLSPLFECSELEFLIINRTDIDSIPDDIEKLTKLKRLSVSNKLVHISDSIYKLTDMRYLSFGGNKKLEYLPGGVVNMTKLLHFDVSRTAIKELPEGISALPLEKVMIYQTECKSTLDYKKLKLKLGDEFKE